MVLGSGGTVVPDPSLPTPSSRHSDTAIEQGSSQGSDQPKPSCLAPRAEASKDSLAQWRHRLRLLKEVQPEQSMRQNGPFLSDGVRQVRWTSGLHL